MLEIEKKVENDLVRITMKGVIDEQAALETQIGRSMKEMHIDTRMISRINSQGVKEWRTFFQRARQDGIRIKFWGLAPPLVDQLNHLGDFVPLSEIESICTPHYCEKCAHVTIREFSLSQLIQMRKILPSIPCEKCQGPAEFDELDEDYFAFLSD